MFVKSFVLCMDSDHECTEHEIDERLKQWNVRDGMEDKPGSLPYFRSISDGRILW